MSKFFRYFNKKFLLCFAILFSLNVYSQDTNYKEYSYTQFMELMQNETDSVFKMENAVVKYDSITDKDFLVPRYFGSSGKNNADKKQKLTINKRIELENVQFLSYLDLKTENNSSLHHIIFTKSVVINNSFLINLSNCEFKDKFTLVNFEYEKFEALDKKYPKNTGNIEIYNSQFSGDVRIIQSSTSIAGAGRNFGFTLGDNIFEESTTSTFIGIWELQFVFVGNNTFNSLLPYYIQVEETDEVHIDNNLFLKGLPELYCIEIEELIFKDNAFNTPSLLNLKITNNTNFIGNNKFNGTTSSLDGFNDYRTKIADKYEDKIWWHFNTLEYYNKYEEQEKIQNPTYYQYELDQKSIFYNYFKERHNTLEANKFYTQIKDLENKRLIYDYSLEPNFNKYFKIQINKFLKHFSNYGTEPERAVLVSLYVILFFALIYLLFPNSWDKHGKNRIMNRYRFFTKYMNKEAGIHEVYLEEQQDELLESEDFKNYMLKSEKHIPKFFLATAIPLYKWSVSGTKLSASFLKRIDIMKGTWDDLPKSKRIWKSILLVGAFIIAVIYDVFIKVLNALMLSINTFTTLGFGEIPIKGLPRYLAIIQGFIGWFMLTIFSVSLISQLLN